MNKFNRTLFQLVLWGSIWVILGVNQRDFLPFFQDNYLAYLSQIVLIVGLIYLLAPTLLFKKKYFLFGVVSIVFLLFFAFGSSHFMDHRQMVDGAPPLSDMGINRPPPIRERMKQGPSPVVINLLLLSVSYILSIFLETFSFAQKKEEALQFVKTENIQNELKFLKSQINPHFLFNSLNNIYALSIIDATKAQESILYLSDMLRYVLYDCEKSSVAIEKEVTYIEDFINLFLLKSSKKYPIKTQFSIGNKSLMIAPMLLIPFVENAFKHSNVESLDGGFISIVLSSTSDSVHFTIENSFTNGQKVQDSVGGIGIINVRKRLKLLYPNAHSLEIVENNNTFSVELKINANA